MNDFFGLLRPKLQQLFPKNMTKILGDWNFFVVKIPFICPRLLQVVLASMFSLTGCDKITAIAGGPADGHDNQWYQAHYTEAKAEVGYCDKKYHGPNSTEEDLAKMPNFCTLAYDATTAHEAPLKGWAYWEALCKIGNPAGRKNSCDFAVRAATGVDTNSKEAQDILAQEIAHLPNALK